LGQCVEVLAEAEIQKGLWQGTSQNYLQVVFPGPGVFQQGLIVEVKLLELTADGLMGKPLTPPLQK
jgi:tRNA A37 methylthiotransferase MiaB